MSEENILKQIVKYNLPTNIPSTPQSHITQLKDLLCMVKHFGMPHFFKHSKLTKQDFFNGKKLLTLKKLQNKYTHH
jgi:hypothetical protein